MPLFDRQLALLQQVVALQPVRAGLFQICHSLVEVGLALFDAQFALDKPQLSLGERVFADLKQFDGPRLGGRFALLEVLFPRGHVVGALHQFLLPFVEPVAHALPFRVQVGLSRSQIALAAIDVTPLNLQTVGELHRVRADLFKRLIDRHALACFDNIPGGHELQRARLCGRAARRAVRRVDRPRESTAATEPLGRKKYARSTLSVALTASNRAPASRAHPAWRTRKALLTSIGSVAGKLHSVCADADSRMTAWKTRATR